MWKILPRLDPHSEAKMVILTLLDAIVKDAAYTNTIITRILKLESPTPIKERCTHLTTNSLLRVTGFVHFFQPKIQGLFKAFQGHIFPSFKDSNRGAKSSQYNATSDAQCRECADFRLRHLS